MRHAEESGFELRGWQPHTGIEQGAMEAAELRGVARGGALPIGDLHAGKEEREHRTYAVGGHRDARFVRGCSHTCHQLVGVFIELLVELLPVCFQLTQSSDARSSMKT